MYLFKHKETQPAYKGEEPLILWNHRWEHDKNPETFFKALFQLKEEGCKFKLALLGEMYKSSPQICYDALEILKEEIVVQGFLSAEDYSRWLVSADILPVTSYHDFFGISVMEGIYCGATPLLPNRLTYPDLYKIEENPEIFYENDEEFEEKLRRLIQNYGISYKHLTLNYDWSNMINLYDETLKGTV
jgi:glycosyltransferase involved in cell wall biosynthesis